MMDMELFVKDTRHYIDNTILIETIRDWYRQYETHKDNTRLISTTRDYETAVWKWNGCLKVKPTKRLFKSETVVWREVKPTKRLFKSETDRGGCPFRNPRDKGRYYIYNISSVIPRASAAAVASLPLLLRVINTNNYTTILYTIARYKYYCT